MAPGRKPSAAVRERKLAENMILMTEMKKHYQRKCEEYDKINNAPSTSEAEQKFEIEKIVRKRCGPKVAQHCKTVKFYREKMNTYNKRLQKEQEAAGVTLDWKLCEICQNEYKNERGRIPRILPCGHTLCEYCANEQFYGMGIPEIWCPFDRTSFTLKKSDVSVLPVNQVVIST